MNRSLPPQPNLDYLKREAKRVLRTFRTQGDADVSLLRLTVKYADVPAEQIRSAATLLEVQHALAVSYGFPGWKELKAFVESTTPVLRALRPVFHVGSLKIAIEHYVEWLGFNLDWEWREAPGQPAVGAFSRDEASFMVVESDDADKKSEVHLDVKNFEALLGEWNRKRPGSAVAHIGPPGEFPEFRAVDPWGNVIAFEGKEEADEQRRRESIRPKMREYIQAQLDAGRPFPTPEEVRDVVGPPLVSAIDVLNEFPGYAEAFAARYQAHAGGMPDRQKGDPT